MSKIPRLSALSWALVVTALTGAAAGQELRVGADGRAKVVPTAKPIWGPQLGVASVPGRFTPRGSNGSDACGDAPNIGEGTHPFDNTAATTDAGSSCGGGAIADIWWRYTPTASGTAVVSGCGGTTLDTVFSAFDNCFGSELACNDDTCGLASQIFFQVNAGTPVLFRLAAFDEAARGAGTFTITIDTGPGNDNCADALPIGEGTVAFNTSLATTDGPFEPTFCRAFNYSQVNQDIWYIYTASASGDARANLCTSGYDTKIAIYLGAACPEVDDTAIACNDDFCGVNGWRSLLQWPVTGGQQYLVRVGGYAGASGPGSMTLSVVTSCNITPPGDATLDSDGSCGNETNQGCQDESGTFQALSSLPASIAGTLYADLNLHDEDWYSFTLAGPATIVARARSEFSLRMGLGAASCPFTPIADIQTQIPCEELEVTESLQAGTYTVFIRNVGGLGNPCGSGNDDYVLSIEESGPACPPDYDGDGFLTGLDFDAFVIDFEAGDPNTDYDGDGFVTGLDFDAYVLDFEAGC